jgi:hypothetical protein
LNKTSTVKPMACYPVISPATPAAGKRQNQLSVFRGKTTCRI